MSDWITLLEAADLTGRDEAEVYMAARRGEVRALRVEADHTWRVDRASVLSWAATR